MNNITLNELASNDSTFGSPSKSNKENKNEHKNIFLIQNNLSEAPTINNILIQNSNLNDYFPPPHLKNMMDSEKTKKKLKKLKKSSVGKILDFDLLLKEVIINKNLNPVIISSTKKKFKNSKKILNKKIKRTILQKKFKSLNVENTSKKNGK